MAGYLKCGKCGQRFSDVSEGRSHSNQSGHQVRPLELDEYDQPPASEPIHSYIPETTADHREMLEDNPGQTHNLTESIAQIVTRSGGRIRKKFNASIDRQSRNQNSEWTMYAPTPNPYHVVAVVVDFLLEADAVKDVQVSIAEQTPAEHTDMLRESRMMFEFNANEYEHLEQFIREVRWKSGIDRNEGLAGPDDVGEAARDYVKRLVAAPGDAWDHHRIQITIREKRDHV